MSPQGVTRKRPAPGTSPVVHPQLNPLSTYPQNTGNSLSNDQFLQWGQNPSPNASSPSYPDTNPYSATAYTSSPDVPAATVPASGQLARRQTPTQQLVSRGRGFEQTQTPFPDHGNGNGESGGWGESLEDLYQRAMVAKRDSQAKRKQIPPFVQKLSSFLDESKNTELIRWSDDGNSFIVMDEDEFAKTLIPELFKHNNYASFVRQLNMYGFHKKVGLSDNSMRASERKNKSPSEYANPYFKRGHPDLLWLIQKPKNTAGQGNKIGKGNVRVKTEDVEEDEDYGDEMAPSRDDRARNRQLSLVTNNNSMPKDQLTGVYRELQAIRQQQQIISNTISKLRREHEQLYAQAANFQEQHTRHENSINAILTFLATVYNRSLQGQEGPQNLANSFAGAISQDQGNVVDMGDDYLLSTLGASNLSNLNSPGGQRSMKKQPLLLKAPPGSDRQSRATTLSPATSAYDRSQSRGHGRQTSTSQPGHVEEVFDNSPRQKESTPASQQFPQRDIMSVIQNTNARNGMPTTFADFPNVLSSLETSGGNSPLTPNQRADMLRLMANETIAGGSHAPVPPNNALVTPTPPPMPHNYSGPPPAPSPASAPTAASPLPPLDLDQIFSNDYFTDIADLEHNKANLDFGDATAQIPTTTSADPVVPSHDDPAIKDASELFDFDHIPADGDLFGTANPQNHSATAAFYNNNNSSSSSSSNFDGTGYGGDAPLPIDSGRIETLPDSESTSPAGTVDDGLQYRGASDAADSQAKDTGAAKRRRKA
ncbi:heat shock transcription factor [Aspergillus heteromorphus CBS 117.55]|uniref:Heat shock transcription factor n=1 Tax=Aspergillus heteromorphus CBS 117.55 TaxID=1448321 RepID=A0A317W8P4_9EURO|nr:heat shock transcription factor [Aspergillus heteromorphus CBS 117.55]PWY80500.1 heat shock transcription factor [Aspergillus heteromorphus CBS 117.55]